MSSEDEYNKAVGLRIPPNPISLPSPVSSSYTKSNITNPSSTLLTTPSPCHKSEYNNKHYNVFAPMSPTSPTTSRILQSKSLQGDHRRGSPKSMVSARPESNNIYGSRSVRQQMTRRDQQFKRSDAVNQSRGGEDGMMQFVSLQEAKRQWKILENEADQIGFNIDYFDSDAEEEVVVDEGAEEEEKEIKLLKETVEVLDEVGEMEKCEEMDIQSLIEAFQSMQDI